MLSLPELEAIRRSAAMAPLSPDAMNELLDTCDVLLRQRVRSGELVEQLRPAWATVRETLNELAGQLTIEVAVGEGNASSRAPCGPEGSNTAATTPPRTTGSNSATEPPVRGTAPAARARGSAAARARPPR